MLLALRLTSRVTWSSKSGVPVMFVCWFVAGWLNMSARPVSLSTYPASCRLLPRFSPATSVCDRSACRVRCHCRLACIWCWVVRLLCSWHTLQKLAPENWRRFLACLSYNLVPNFSGARFWSQIEHVLFRDRIWRPRDLNTDLWLVSDQCCCCFRLLEL